MEEPDWHIIVGAVGAGRTTALSALARREKATSFLLAYPQERWPGGSQEYVAGGNHLSQIMALVANALRDELKQYPTKLPRLSKTQAEFMRWLFEKRLGERVVNRLLEEIDPRAQSRLAQVRYQELYPSDTVPRDVQGQIEELAGLVQTLDYQRVLVLMDINLTIGREQLSNLLSLFSWLKLMEHPGFSISATFPAALYRKHQIGIRTRSRARIFELEWSSADVEEIVQNRLKAATSGQISSLGQLASPALLNRLDAWLTGEYSQPTPQGWVNLARVLLDSLASRKGRLAEDHFEEIVYRFFETYMPIYFDLNSNEPGIWRGPRFISLEEQPYNFLRALSATNAAASISPGRAERSLIQVAGSKGNIHTLARRVRVAIEPNQEAPIYLKNTRREGYWLDHCLNTGPAL